MITLMTRHSKRHWLHLKLHTSHLYSWRKTLCDRSGMSKFTA